MEQVIETIDLLVLEIERAGNISIDRYLELRAKAESALSETAWWAEQSGYLRRAHGKIKGFVEKSDERLLQQIVSEFNQSHRKFENEYLSCDAEAIRQRRAALDELTENYCLIGSKTKGDKGIRSYVAELNKREEITKDFETIKEVYERATEDRDIERLRNLASRRLIGGSRLNITNIIKAYRSVHYEEGAVEAEKLQREIKDYIKGKAPKRKTTYFPEQSETAETEQGYFCLSSHMLSLGYGPSNQTYEIYKALTEDGKRKTWHQRLRDLNERINMFAPSFRREDYEYVKTVRDYVNRSAKRGELALLAAHNGCEAIVKDLVNSLNQYLASSEALIREQSVQKAALAV